MSRRVIVRFTCVSLGVMFVAAVASAYIHLPSRTLQDLCKGSNQIRLLKVEKLDKEKGVLVFEAAKSLKGDHSQIAAVRHIIRTDAEGVKPILDWAGEGKSAVMFSVETERGGAARGSGFVFIDEYCYSVDYNKDGKYWRMLRAEPGMSVVYHGSVERLRQAVESILTGKEVKVPTKEPEAKVNPHKRSKEITEMEIKNQTRHEIAPADETKPVVPGINDGSSSLNSAWIVAGIPAIMAIIWFGRRKLRGRIQ